MANNLIELSNMIVQSSEVVIEETEAVVPPKVVMFKWGGVDRKFRCQLCDMSFVKGEELKVHMDKHELERKDGDDGFRCSVCHKSFKSQRNLQTHLKIHSGVEKFRCKYCHKCFFSQIHLQKHIVTHTDLLQCNICSEKFLYESSLLNHMIKHSTVQAFKCEICGKQFKRDHMLRRHRFKHDQDEGRRYKCVECGKSFMHSYVMKQHMRSIHSNEPDGCECPICKKFIRNKANLKRHLLIHADLRQFKCEICEKAFIQKRHLEEHMQTHSLERNFKCATCGQMFKQKRGLNRHLKTHSDSIKQKPKQSVPCKFCDEVLTSKDELKTHMSDVHSDYQCCNACGIYVKKSWMEKHIKYHCERVEPKAIYVNNSTMTEPMAIETVPSSETNTKLASNRSIGACDLKNTFGNIGNETHHTNCETKMINNVNNLDSSSDFENCSSKEIDVHRSQYPSNQTNCSHGNQTNLHGNQTSSFSFHGNEAPIIVNEAGDVICYMYNSDAEKLNANTTQGTQTVLTSEDQLLKFIQESCVDNNTKFVMLTENSNTQLGVSLASEISFVPGNPGNSFDNSVMRVPQISSNNTNQDSGKAELSTAITEFSTAALENETSSQQLVWSTSKNSIEYLQSPSQLESTIATSTISMDRQNENFNIIKNSLVYRVEGSDFIPIGTTSDESMKTKLEQNIPKVTTNISPPVYGNQKEKLQEVIGIDQNRNVNQTVESEEGVVINIPDTVDCDATRSILFQSLIDYAERIMDQPSTN